jgi:hypothetical protein
MNEQRTFWILLSLQPDLRLKDTRTFRTFRRAAACLRRRKALGLLVDASFGNEQGNAWASAFAAREMFPDLAIAVIHGLAPGQKGSIRPLCRHRS